MRSDQRHVSLSAFATAVAALVGGIFWAANDARDAELIWGLGVLAAAYGVWKWRQHAQRNGTRD